MTLVLSGISFITPLPPPIWTLFQLWLTETPANNNHNIITCGASGKTNLTSDNTIVSNFIIVSNMYLII